MGGTYTLLVRLTAPAAIEVGALGTHRFEPGWYGYTGSALGAGGFARVDRHGEIASGVRDTRHWHIDYLLGHPDATLADDVRTESDIECAVAGALPTGPVEGFGASDCDCRGHLAYAPDGEKLKQAVRAAHDEPR
ncbi:DUF123 domain-containing protein [Halobacteriales archaeon SW_8_65_20]|nr:MAG: DUF123 domain-containing protein [Halobacteriales archaeon SW_8_65_20]